MNLLSSRKLICCFVALLCLIATGASASSSDVVVVHAGQLLPVPGFETLQNQTVVIEAGVIRDVLSGFVEPETIDKDAAVIDLKNHFVLPGLMDMHVHLLAQLGPNSRADAMTVTTSMSALKGAQFAYRTLKAGFTTVRDLGGTPEAIFALRDAINQGVVPGPRILAAGSALAATGGHGDVDGYKAQLLDLWTPNTICDGPYSCRRAVRYAVKYGADWIKITATGGVLSDTATGLEQQMTDGELKEIIDTAHGLGVKVAAHAHGNGGIKAALRAGVDSIDHGTFLDAEAVKMLKRSNAYLVPTLLPGYVVPKMMAGTPFYTAAIAEKADLAAGASQASLKMAYDAGVNIAFGTDTGVTAHGKNAEEFALMVAYGMTPMDAIRSATVVTAELLSLSDQVGTIEPGKMADMIAVKANPLEDIRALEQVEVVIKSGRLVL